MRRIALMDICEGMILARPLYGPNGQIVINNGIPLQPSHIAKLKDLDIVDYIYVEDDNSKYIDQADKEAQQIRTNLLKEACDTIKNVQLGKYVDLGQEKTRAVPLLDELFRLQDLQPIFMAMKNCNDYLFAHSVTGFFLGIVLGAKLGLEGNKLRDLGTGALLRDSGMIKIDPAILNKPGKLTDAENKLIRQHPEAGFELLRTNPDISLASATCALQHHERFDGSGYPQRLANTAIHEYSCIVALTDVFTAMTSPTPYRKAIPVYDTLAIIQRTGETLFQPELIRLLAETTVFYPIGATVRLSDKTLGTITGYRDGDKLIPFIQVTCDENGQSCKRLAEMNLARNPNLYITEVL